MESNLVEFFFFFSGGETSTLTPADNHDLRHEKSNLHTLSMFCIPLGKKIQHVCAEVKERYLAIFGSAD